MGDIRKQSSEHMNICSHVSAYFGIFGGPGVSHRSDFYGISRHLNPLPYNDYMAVAQLYILYI